MSHKEGQFQKFKELLGMKELIDFPLQEIVKNVRKSFSVECNFAKV